MNSISFTPQETGPNAPAPETPDFSNEPNRPDWLPPQFKDPQTAIKSLQDTQAELTRAKQELAKLRGETPAQPQQEAPKEDKPPVDEAAKAKNVDEAAEKLAKEAGLDLAPYQEEYFSSGDVSEESRTKLAEAYSKVLGPDARQVVDDFIESRKVLHANDQKIFMDAAGGEQSYSAMVQWATQNLSKEEITAYNKQVNSGDRHATLFAIDALRSRYEAANGRAPNLVHGGPSSGAAGFMSTAEMRRAMADPRYKEDENYRQQVRARLAVSNL